MLADRTVVGADFPPAYSALADQLLRALWSEIAGDGAEGLGLMAVGGYGRGELCPGSDLDLLLLHSRSARARAAKVAEALWYPLWDCGLRLGHAVRTVDEALALAKEDLDTATALLEIRPLAGDRRLGEVLRSRARHQWGRRGAFYLPLLARGVAERYARADEVAFLLEPDLKDGRGGLRDIGSLHWADAARPRLLGQDRLRLAQARSLFTGVRVELHRRTGKTSNRLVLQEQDPVAEALGYVDADALMAAVAETARAVAWIADEYWDQVAAAEAAAPGRRSGAPDGPLAPGVVLADGRVELAEGTDPSGDTEIILRVAAAAAAGGFRLGRRCLDRLAAEAPGPGDPWSGEANRLMVQLLDAGRPALAVLEALDQVGLLVRLIPEWAAVRSKPQRNAYHRFTVDRHLWETAIEAADRVVRVRRPDLLLIGALFHDLGKGYVPALADDHTDAGIMVVGPLARRMGFGPADVTVLEDLVRHHLLLADVATRRDLSDPATIAQVAEAVGDRQTLELLGVLTEADSLATGPAAWSTWKAGLVSDLVRLADARLAGACGLGPGDDLGPPSETLIGALPADRCADLVAEAGPGGISVRGDGERLLVVAPDRPGLFCRVAGALALHNLEVRGARAGGAGPGAAVEEFWVAPTFGQCIDWPAVESSVVRAVGGRLALEWRVNQRAAHYAARHQVLASAIPARTRVTVDNEASASATVVEVRTADGIGVLYRITRALGSLDLDIRSAKVATLGHEVVDSFYVVDAGGARLTDADHLAEIAPAIEAELARTAPSAAASERGARG
ncbi:MAG: [protein-PII] uridylyltransferase [Acidimicrobiales bacterium]